MKKIALLLASVLCALACIFALTGCKNTTDNAGSSDTGTITDTATDTGSSTSTETVTDTGSADTETDTSTDTKADTDIPVDTETNTKDPVDTEDEFVTYGIISEKEAALVEYKGNEKHFTIPSTVTIDSKEYIVTTIANYAFNGCKNINGVTIPFSVTSIGDYAFYGCSNLISITIPGSIVSIGKSAFEKCYKLTEVCNMSSLSIELGSANNGYIGCYATTVYTPASKPECKITITDEGYMFFEYNNLTYLIGYNGDKTSLVLPDKFNDKEYAIKKYAFSDCSSLSSITIPNSITSIGDWAFYNCSSLTSVTIPDSITSIGNYAFSNCSSLTSVTIGNSVTSIGNYAFSNCSNLEAVYITDMASWCNIWFLDNNSNPLFYAKNLYLNGTLVTDLVIPDSVTSIGNWAFDDCSSLTSVTIPDSVTSIGGNAFLGCYKLVEVYNLSSLNITKGSYSNGYVGNYALNIYTAKDTPSKQFTTDDGYIFYEDGETCYLLGYKGTDTELTLPANCNGKTYGIYKYAFYNNKNITGVTIPDSVTSIGGWTFSGCSSLTSVTIPDGVTRIDNNAFYGCSSLTNVTIGDSVTSIGSYAFWNCSSLKKVFYKGTFSEWCAINIDSSNSNLTSATRYYYSETEPTGTGNYWHYGTDGKTILKWE